MRHLTHATTNTTRKNVRYMRDAYALHPHAYAKRDADTQAAAVLASDTRATALRVAYAARREATRPGFFARLLGAT